MSLNDNTHMKLAHGVVSEIAELTYEVEFIDCSEIDNACIDLFHAMYKIVQMDTVTDTQICGTLVPRIVAVVAAVESLDLTNLGDTDDENQFCVDVSKFLDKLRCLNQVYPNIENSQGLMIQQEGLPDFGPTLWWSYLMTDNWSYRGPSSL